MQVPSTTYFNTHANSEEVKVIKSMKKHQDLKYHKHGQGFYNRPYYKIYEPPKTFQKKTTRIFMQVPSTTCFKSNTHANSEEVNSTTSLDKLENKYKKVKKCAKKIYWEISHEPQNKEERNPIIRCFESQLFKLCFILKTRSQKLEAEASTLLKQIDILSSSNEKFALLFKSQYKNITTRKYRKAVKVMKSINEHLDQLKIFACHNGYCKEFEIISSPLTSALKVYLNTIHHIKIGKINI